MLIVFNYCLDAAIHAQVKLTVNTEDGDKSLWTSKIETNPIILGYPNGRALMSFYNDAETVLGYI
jgi:hypothetical protein